MPTDRTQAPNLPTDPEMLLLLFSEWLDGEGLMYGHDAGKRDDRSHEDLARAFIADLSARRNEGQARLDLAAPIRDNTLHGVHEVAVSPDLYHERLGVGTRLREATDRLADEVEAGTYEPDADLCEHRG